MQEFRSKPTRNFQKVSIAYPSPSPVVVVDSWKKQKKVSLSKQLCADVLQLIFSFVVSKDFPRLRHVCRVFHTLWLQMLTLEDSTHWLKITAYVKCTQFQRYFGPQGTFEGIRNLHLPSSMDDYLEWLPSTLQGFAMEGLFLTQEMSQQFTRYTELQILRLPLNYVPNLSWKLSAGLPFLLSTLSNLTELDLSGRLSSSNRIPLDQGSISDSTHLFENLESLQSLTWLNVSDNLMGRLDEVNYLQGLTSLRELYLQRNEIDSIQVRYLTALTKLTSLNVGENQLRGQGICQLSTLISLTALYIHKNQWSVNEGEGQQEWNVLRQFTALRTLDVSENDVNVSSTVTFPVPPSLTSLSLRGLTSQSRTFSGLGGLQPLTKLVRLDLSGNRLQSPEVLLRELRSPSLTALSVDSTELQDEGVIQLLQHLPGLQYLNCRQNSISKRLLKWIELRWKRVTT